MRKRIPRCGPVLASFAQGTAILLTAAAIAGAPAPSAQCTSGRTSDWAVGGFLVDVDGSPQHALLSSGTFGVEGAFVYQAVVPPGLGGIRAQVQAFGFVPTAGIGRFNRVTLQFL